MVETFFFKVGVSVATQLGSRLIERVEGSVKRPRAARREELATLGREVGPFKDLARLYVEPLCQNLNPADSDHDDGPGIATQNGAFELVDKFFRRPVAERNGASTLFVLGDAGMGKTSFLTMLRLAHLSRLFPEEHDCKLVKLGRDTLERLQAVEDPARTILLLDSLDEDPTAHGRIADRLNELLAETNRFQRTIITCRTQYFLGPSAGVEEREGAVKVGAFRCPATYLSLFDDSQVDAYLRKRYPRSFYRWLLNSDDPRHHAARQVVALMRSLKFRPLLLAYVEDLVESSEYLTSEYDMYETLIRRWLEREMIKARKRGDPRQSLDALFRGLTLLAFRAQELGERHFPPREIERITELVNLGLLDHQRVDLKGRSLMNLMSDGSYRFAHFSIQEFLVARGVVYYASDACNYRLRNSTLLGAFVRAAFNETRGSRQHGPVHASRVDLSSLDLCRVNLDAAVFEGATLKDCRFVRTSLERADLSNADLSGADLSFANLFMANLTAANLAGANLRRACLVGARLDSAVLTGATVDKADLRRASLVGCIPDIRELGDDVYYDEHTRFY